MAVILVDDKGREATVEGDWIARMMGADFGGRGQIMVWLKPGADGWLEPVIAAPEIEAPQQEQHTLMEGN